MSERYYGNIDTPAVTRALPSQQVRAIPQMCEGCAVRLEPMLFQEVKDTKYFVSRNKSGTFPRFPNTG